jgi:putative ATP-binding cassette transporter
MNRIGTLLRDAWRLGLPYFARSEERWSARLILLGIVVLALIQVGGDVLINFWYGQFYDALQHKDLDGFVRLLLWYRWDDQNGFMPGFVPIVTPLVPLGSLQYYVQRLLQIRWRQWLTDQFLSEYLSGRVYYTIGITTAQGDPTTDNPDQRIAEDIRDFTATTLSLGIDFISRTTGLFNFALILWSLSGSIEIFGITVPGYMLWGAVLYAVIGTWLTHVVGRPLIPLNFLRQKAEADFRFALVRFRENSEGVALFGGEGEERSVLGARFAEVTRNWHRLMSRLFKLALLQDSYTQAAVVFPFVLGAPSYFAGKIELGGLMRVVSAFGQVQRSLSWFVSFYDQLASWSATVHRLTSFKAALVTAQSVSQHGPKLVPDHGAISLRKADIRLPDGQKLLEHPDVVLESGRSVAIGGPSGTGKSTLFRAIAGIWPFGGGQIERAPGSYLFLPQRPYIPLGTLRHAITYPGAPDAFSERDIGGALKDAGLGALASKLDEDHPWAQTLSGGEQQRLAIARALLLRPDWLFLDEATSSLDPEAEAELYAVLRRELPGTTVVSIAHRTDVARWHDESLLFTRVPGEAGRIAPRQPATAASTAAP